MIQAGCIVSAVMLDAEVSSYTEINLTDQQFDDAKYLLVSNAPAGNRGNCMQNGIGHFLSRA